MLGFIGYDTRSVKVGGRKFRLLIQAYQRHHRQSNVLGEIDKETIGLIKNQSIGSRVIIFFPNKLFQSS